MSKRSKLKYASYAFTVFLFCNTLTLGQSKDIPQSIFPHGLGITFGIAKASLKDEYISNEKYSGQGTGFSVNWLKFHETYMYDLGMDVFSGSNIKNNSISAQVNDFAFRSAYLYPLGKIQTLGNDMYFFAGPNPEIYLHRFEQQLTKGGSAQYEVNSQAFLLSLGVKGLAFIPVSQKLFIKGELSSAIISLGSKTHNTSTNTSSSATKILTLFNGLRLSTRYSLEYNVLSMLTVGCGYKFDLTRISEWNPLTFASDEVFIKIAIAL